MPHKSTTVSSLSPMPKTIAGRRSLLISNRPFLDFINSSYCPVGLADPLEEWAHFLHFLVLARLLDHGRAESLLIYGGSTAQAALDDAAGLRTALALSCKHIMRLGKVPDEAITTINTALQYEDGGFRLTRNGTRFSLVLYQSAPSAKLPLAEIARSAADFLCNDQLSRLRTCANPDCPLHFYDTSKNGRRRWCRMDICGNRAKATSHYQRSKRITFEQ
jgi:hypothetical protein